MDAEIWKPIYFAPPWKERYEVSNLGRVRRCATGIIYKTGQSGRNGRPQVKLHDGLRCVSRQVAHLVAEAFLGARAANQRVAFVDGNPCNVRASNLYYCKRDPAVIANNHGGAVILSLDRSVARVAAEVFATVAPQITALLRMGSAQRHTLVVGTGPFAGDRGDP